MPTSPPWLFPSSLVTLYRQLRVTLVIQISKVIAVASLFVFEGKATKCDLIASTTWRLESGDTRTAGSLVASLCNRMSTTPTSAFSGGRLVHQPVSTRDPFQSIVVCFLASTSGPEIVWLRGRDRPILVPICDDASTETVAEEMAVSVHRSIRISVNQQLLHVTGAPDQKQRPRTYNRFVSVHIVIGRYNTAYGLV